MPNPIRLLSGVSIAAAAFITIQLTLLDAVADVTLPNIFCDHMVLQRDQANKLWGKSSASESVSATIAGQTVTTQANADGLWSLMLPSLEAGGPHSLVVRASNEITINDVLVGEVWICSGQSNMQWKVGSANDADLEQLASHYPQIRMINFPQVGSQTPVWSHDAARWQVCSSGTVKDFSAVGYFFARQVHQTIGVPVGMINNAWGGSACEAWVDRPTLSKAGSYQGLLDTWAVRNQEYAKLSSIQNPTDEDKVKLANIKKLASGNQNPSNIYNGVLASHIGYGIKGAIWYQGESNASRAYQYRELFPLMITTWRSRWNQGDFPFYWVQLADFKGEIDEPNESEWAELREAQSMTMKTLPKTGQAVIIDIGEGKDIHPRNKVDVGRRLARWALANEYGVEIAFRSPEFKSMAVLEGKATLQFDYLGSGWRPFDTAEPKGFAIAGKDRKFVWAKATIGKDNSVQVSSALVPNPVAVRYAWADNPRCNMYSQSGLPLTPFRTDEWPGLTADSKQ
ncbi:MAG: sialate O-acetylesterase [Pirellulaceae bacterium]|nr:sialate O-acetylesterase [Pirellulaceae bacterium]